MRAERPRRRVLVAALAALVTLASGLGAAASSAAVARAPAPPAAARPAAARPAAGARLVVLGDSVPYGVGLANPGRTRRGPLPPDQGPSARAWPSLVDAGLRGFAPLRLRPTACTLVTSGPRPFDSLAVSGASAVRTGFTGLSGDCTTRSGTPVPQQVVSPDELTAARLRADPPALVTVQVGADDIRFSGCLAALLGLSAAQGAVPCVAQTAAGLRLTPRTRIELAGLARGLAAIIGTVHRQAPHARVLVLDYYQIVPVASAALSGSSPLCTDLELESAVPGFRSTLRARAAFALGRLDGTIASVTRHFPDVSLVSLSTAFAGHELCTANTWLFSTTWDAAHPTAVGQRHIAAAVLATCRPLARRCRGR